MLDTETARFTIGVFQDAAWAAKGLAALRDARFTADMFSVLAKESPEATALIEKTFGAKGDRMDIAGVGAVVARGPLVAVLHGAARDLGKIGIAGSIRRVGF